MLEVKKREGTLKKTLVSNKHNVLLVKSFFLLRWTHYRDYRELSAIATVTTDYNYSKWKRDFDTPSRAKSVPNTLMGTVSLLCLFFVKKRAEVSKIMSVLNDHLF